MQDILEYKKLLRQRDKLVKKLDETTDAEEKKEVNAEIQDIDDLLEHMRLNSKSVQDFLRNGLSQDNTENKEEISSDSNAQEETKEKESGNLFYGCIFFSVVLSLVFFGFKSCLNRHDANSRKDFSVESILKNGENELRLEEQQELIKKQQQQISEQERRIREQEKEKAELQKKEQHETLVRNSIYVSNARYEPNIFDGFIYFSFTLTNLSSKIIKYYYIWVDIYNRVDDLIEKDWCGKYTVTLNGGQQENVTFKLTNDDQASLFRVKKMRVEYMDGTVLEVSPDEISQIYKHD